MRKFDVINNLAKRSQSFTFQDALTITRLTRKSIRDLLYDMEKQGYIERIERGKYMIIPLGAEKGKYTLNEFVIGSMLVNPYCISYWSALHFYGLTEQIPNTVFIQTIYRKKRQELDIFGIKYKVVKIKEDKFFGLRKEWIDENQINISEKEKTIVDCLDKPYYCGGIIEVAKALHNGQFDLKRLSEYAQRINNSGVIRRLGYICDLLNIEIELPEINTRNYLLLDTVFSNQGPKNAK